MTKKEIGNIVRDARNHQDMTHYMVGKSAKIHQDAVVGIEQGSSNYTIDTLLKVCDVLGLKLVILKQE